MEYEQYRNKLNYYVESQEIADFWPFGGFLTYKNGIFMWLNLIESESLHPL